jgi:TetR/AcrR family transcriptional repressor of nem operon
MLTERGYHGTGLQQLLQGTGIPKGSFYNYFPSKETFSAEAIGHYIEPFIRQLDDYLSRPDLGALSAIETYFADLVDELDRNHFRGGCLLGNLIGEMGDSGGQCVDALRDAFHRYRDKLEQGLVRAQAEGSVRADLSPAVMADLLADAWQGALLRMKIERSVKPLKDTLDHLLGGYFRA